MYFMIRRQDSHQLTPILLTKPNFDVDFHVEFANGLRWICGTDLIPGIIDEFGSFSISEQVVITLP